MNKSALMTLFGTVGLGLASRYGSKSRITQDTKYYYLRDIMYIPVRKDVYSDELLMQHIREDFSALDTGNYFQQMESILLSKSPDSPFVVSNTEYPRGNGFYFFIDPYLREITYRDEKGSRYDQPGISVSSFSITESSGYGGDLIASKVFKELGVKMDWELEADDIEYLFKKLSANKERTPEISGATFSVWLASYLLLAVSYMNNSPSFYINRESAVRYASGKLMSEKMANSFFIENFQGRGTLHFRTNREKDNLHDLNWIEFFGSGSDYQRSFLLHFFMDDMVDCGFDLTRLSTRIREVSSFEVGGGRQDMATIELPGKPQIKVIYMPAILFEFTAIKAVNPFFSVFTEYKVSKLMARLMRSNLFLTTKMPEDLIGRKQVKNKIRKF